MTEISKAIQSSDSFRRELTTKSLAWFTLTYLSHYIHSSVPDFHWEMYADLENEDINLLEVIAFRGSAKSTIVSLAYAMWCAITGRKKFIVISSATSMQTRLIMRNLAVELEGNELLIKDYGQFYFTANEWQVYNLVLPNGARIMGRSRGQRVRGIRHKEARPDLFIGDDIESMEDVRTKERRDRTDEWFHSEVMPALSPRGGKAVLIGNLLHSDSFYMRLRDKIGNTNQSLYRQYALHDAQGNCLWEEMYDDNRINQIKEGRERFYLREYELKIIPEEGRVINKVHYYAKLPTLRRIGIGTDLAISERTSADYTAFSVFGEDENNKLYSLYQWQGRVSFNDTLTQLQSLYQTMQAQYPDTSCSIFWEDVGYQRAGAQELTRRYNLPIVMVKRSTDKRSRLQTIEPRLTNAQVMFREHGDEDAVIQIMGFGVESHDDLVDSNEIVISGLTRNPSPSIAWL